MSDRITELGEKIEALTGRLARLSANPASDGDLVRGLLAELGQLEELRREAIGARFSASTPTSVSAYTQVRPGGRPTMPVRERVLAALELLGVPLRGGLVTAASLARTGLPVEPSQLASLRRS